MNISILRSKNFNRPICLANFIVKRLGVLLLRRRYPLENAVLVDNFRIIEEARLIKLKLHLFAIHIFNVLHIQNLDKFGRIIGLNVLNLVCNNRISSVSVVKNSVFLEKQSTLSTSK